MIVSGHTTLTALQESESYTIRCSTGSVIPVDADGHPSAGTVEASFWKFDEASGKTVAVTAERSTAYFFSEAGGSKDRTVRDSHTLDLTPMLGDSQVSFVRVILYADDAGTRSLRSADFTLAYPTAVAQWRIECSTGNTIPVGKDGKPAGTVKAVVKRAGADGAFSRQAVDKLTATAYAGSAPVTYAVAEGTDEIELRGLLTSAAYSFVRVEASEGGKAVAQADFALSFPTTFPLALEANGTAGPLMFDAYGSFQGGALTVRLVRGTQAVAGRAQMVAWYDTGGTSSTGFLDVPAAGRDFLPELSGMREYALSHVVFRFHEQDEAEADAREQRFEVSYATPVTFFRRDAWSAGNSYKNGEVLLLTRTTDGGQEVSEVYRWQYPVGGNTGVDPWTYFSSGAKPAYWAQHESWPLLFTESLIAPFALLGGAVFLGDYMMSQQGTDRTGAESSDYRKFPQDFTPRFKVDWRTGDTRMGGGTFSGLVRNTPLWVTDLGALPPGVGGQFGAGGGFLWLTDLSRGSFVVYEAGMPSGGANPQLFLPCNVLLSGARVTVMNRDATATILATALGSEAEPPAGVDKYRLCVPEDELEFARPEGWEEGDGEGFDTETPGGLYAPGSLVLRLPPWSWVELLAVPATKGRLHAQGTARVWLHGLVQWTPVAGEGWEDVT